MVIVFNISIWWMVEGGLVVFDLVFYSSKAFFKAAFLDRVCLVMLIKCSSQPFSNVGNQREADVVGPFNDLECSA